MDVNLTGQFWGMPAFLTGEINQDWQLILLPILVPLVVVLIATISTYFITVTIEERKHRKELRRQVYFELIDVITKSRKVYEDSWHNQSTDQMKMDEDIKIAHAFVAAKFKTYIGGSKALNDLVDDQIQSAITNRDESIYQAFLKTITDQMTKELIQPTFLDKTVVRAWNWLAGRDQG